MSERSKNAIRCKKWRDSLDAQDRKEKDRNRKRQERQKLKQNKEKYESALLKDKCRKRMKARNASLSSISTSHQSATSDPTSNSSASTAIHAPNTANTSSTFSASTPEPACTTKPSTPPSKSSPFSTKQSLYRCMKKTRSNLPKDSHQRAYLLSNLISTDLSPNKKDFVLESLRRKCSPSQKGRKKILSPDREEFLLGFMQTPGISYTMPGHRDTVYVGMVDGQRQYKPKHYLLWHVRELTGMLNQTKDPNALHESFIDKFGSEISFSSVFRFIKSQKHILYQAEIPSVSCLCSKCENFELLVEGIRTACSNIDIPHSTEDILKLFTCDKGSRTCAYGECNNCPSPCLQKLEEVEEVHFYSWETHDGKKYPEKLPKTVTGEEASTLLLEQVAKIKVHMYLKQKQYISYQKTKGDLKENELLIHVDFSENYDNKQKNAIQSAYFGYQSFSLYTVCVYRCEKSEITCDSYALVSGTTDHTAKVVFGLNRFLLKHLNAKQKFDTVHFFSDGAACQFRSKHVFAFLAQYDPAMKIKWHFFETSHGKGPVDGVGGTVKSVVHRKVMSGHVVIGSAKEFAEYANLVIKNIEVLYVSSENMEVGIEQNAEPPKVPGTLQVRYIERQVTDNQVVLSFYQVSPQSGDIIPPFREASYIVKGNRQCQPTSICSQEQSTTDMTDPVATGMTYPMANDIHVTDPVATDMTDPVATDMTEPVPTDIHVSDPIATDIADTVATDMTDQTELSCIPGQWYAAYYSEFNYWFVGLVRSVEGKSVEMDFLQQKRVGINAFTHEHEDIKSLPTQSIFHKLEEAPVPVSRFRYDVLCLSEGDFSQIQRIFMDKYHS
ncbi:uncharacterized protein LOC121421100 [Lytechinus variegatus]|uniref:uncharacterized protein LOC121421100 n=1 Tax=Lytechinus variegatus TaxID=7654 RepID=UPI001BB21298|nr:uncharacterized protein LOC121421100 [Lytechinus variegatus]